MDKAILIIYIKFQSEFKNYTVCCFYLFLKFYDITNNKMQKIQIVCLIALF